MSDSNQQIRHLLALCALRDRNALKQLYDLTAAQLFGLLLRIVIHRDWAEDILQEGFLNIWHHADQYREDKGAPLTWMTGIVRHRAIDWLRRYRPQTVVQWSEQEWEDLSSAEPQQEDVMMAQQEYARLSNCLESLDPQQAQAIKLSYYQGLTHQSLAERLNKPLGTVKSWIRRGLEALKRCLSP